MFKVLNGGLSKAVLPEDGDRFVEDIFSGEQFSSSHCNIIGQFDSEGLQIKNRMVHYYNDTEIVPEDPWRPAVNNRLSIC